MVGVNLTRKSRFLVTKQSRFETTTKQPTLLFLTCCWLFSKLYAMNRMLLISKPKNITCCALFALSALTTTARSFAPPLNTGSSTRTMSSSTSCKAAGLEIVQVPCLSDNYGYLIHDPATGSTAVVDTPEAKPYQEEMAKRGWKLTHIFNTHQSVKNVDGVVSSCIDRERSIFSFLFIKSLGPYRR